MQKNVLAVRRKFLKWVHHRQLEEILLSSVLLGSTQGTS